MYSRDLRSHMGHLVRVVANQAGFRYFTTEQDFKRYVSAEMLAEPLAS